MTGANITEDKDALIRSLQEQLKAKDKQIASLEDTVIDMSLELATSKAMEDYQHQQLQQQQDKKHTDKTWMSRLQEEEEESQASQPQQQRRPSRRSPSSAINVMSSINKSLSDMLSSMKPHRNNDKTNTIVDAMDDTPTVSSSSLQSFGSSQQPSSDDSREQLQQSVESSGVIVLASRESRKLSMGLSDVVDWDSSKNLFTGWD